MGYLFLIISALLDGVKGCLSKPVSRHTTTLGDSLLINVSRTALCTLFALVFCLTVSGHAPDGRNGMLGVTLLSGASTALFMVSWLMALRTGAFMTLTILGTSSCLLPILLSAIFFGEAILPQHLAGLALLVTASWLLCSYQKKLKGKVSVTEVIWLTLMFISCGFVSFAQKIFVHTVPGGSTADYNFFTYLFATSVMLLFLPASKKEGFGMPPKTLLKKTGLLVLCLSLSLYFVDYFRTLAAATVPAGVLYPMSSGIVMVINLIYSTCFIKEKPTGRTWIGLALTLAAVIVLNL